MKGILLVISVLFFTAFFNEQTVFAAKKSANGDIIITKIKANFIDVKRRDETVYLYGNVIVERQDLSVLADKMVVYYYENSENEIVDKSQTIKKIEAKDNVKVFNSEFTATGKSGVYDPKENNFVLEDDVIFNNGTSVAKGQKFVYNLTTKKGNLVGQKNITQNISEELNPENENTGEDNRVIVIIDDVDIQKSKNNQKKK